MAPLNYPYEVEMDIQLINGKTRKRQTVIFPNPLAAYFFHGGKKYNVWPRPDNLNIAIVTSVQEVPGEDLPET